VTTAANKTIASAITAVAKSVAAAEYKKYFVKTATDDQLSGFANNVAGSAAEEIMLKFPLPVSGTDTFQVERDALLAAIQKAVQSVTGPAGDVQVVLAVDKARAQTGPLFDTACINGPETPVTNF
jgi:hypothetical protein